jgi:2-aminoethylphosphonate-pyruvate transaminase
VKAFDKTYIVDAMSSLGGIPIDMEEVGIDFLIGSSNKCVQGVPGFGIIIAAKSAMKSCCGNARSLSLDLYDQWAVMEREGKWRFTSPTHVVLAFMQAMKELEEEGGVPARFARYSANQARLARGMKELSFRTLLKPEFQSPIITSFLYPEGERFIFGELYEHAKSDGFILYPGKISQADTFRVGSIGDIDANVIDGLLASIGSFMRGEKIRPRGIS